MKAEIQEILNELRSGLERLYGPRLEGVLLFGSHARDEAEPDSDIDVLVLLRHPVDFWSEIQRTGPLVAELCLRHNTVVSCVFDSPTNLEAATDVFHNRIRREGIAL